VIAALEVARAPVVALFVDTDRFVALGVGAVARRVVTFAITFRCAPLVVGAGVTGIGVPGIGVPGSGAAPFVRTRGIAVIAVGAGAMGWRVVARALGVGGAGLRGAGALEVAAAVGGCRGGGRFAADPVSWTWNSIA
jgi:hypothetical protein